MGISYNLVIHENKTKFMTTANEFKNIQKVLGEEKTKEAVYLGFKLNFSEQDTIKEAKRNVKVFLINIKSRIRTNSIYAKKAIC
jgi:hypothetical protein